MQLLVRKFLSVMMASGLASFITLYAVQYFQGGVEPLTMILGKAFMVGFGLALLFAIPRRSQNNYPWM